jgi:endonuclease/exonuclease/phosphatase family metal-dependent hydrolase
MLRFLMEKKKFKILLINLGYCTGINGFFWQYAAKLHRYIFLPKIVEKRTLQKLKQVISREDPDMVCLVEIKKGKQVRSLISDQYLFHDVKIKYGEKSILKMCPFFYNKGNAFIAKENFSFKRHYLESGTKKLVYEIILPNNLSLFLVHLPLSKISRNKQLKSIAKLTEKNEQKIICGDFNILRGLKELESLLKGSDLKIIDPEPTFPAFKPRKFLDLFLCSGSIKATARVINSQISDHLPVVLEIEE